MLIFWYWVACALAVLAALKPEVIFLLGTYLELQFRKLWLLLRLYPRIQIDRLRIKFLLWRHKHNNNDDQNNV